MRLTSVWWFVLVLVGVMTGCAADSAEEATDDAELALGDDPCSDPKIRAKANVKAEPGNPHRFVGTPKNDIIFGTKGNDQIFGGGGDDLICAGDGDDYIDGGDGRDTIFAGAGDDIVHGRGGSDTIHGGAGNDILFGDILDDKLMGEDGNDILVGGHGTDTLNGGPGNDWMRGDTGNDAFIGGAGHDIVSFATAIPPGQPEIKNGATNPIEGVSVCFGPGCGPDDVTIPHDGFASGDGGNEPLDGIEEVVGSPYRDRFKSNGGREFHGGYGDDVFDLEQGEKADKSAGPTPSGMVFLDTTPNQAGDVVDMGLVIVGTATRNDLKITAFQGRVEILTRGGTPLGAGPGCTQAGSTVTCKLGHPLRWLSGYGGDGDDLIELGGDFPREFEAHVSGGRGDDHLVGGDEQDVFFTGIDGKDHLEGRGGDDALLSESHAPEGQGDDRVEASKYTSGADILDGGEGNDQLVADYVCGGHTYIGGPGRDIAGFARSGRHPIHAQLGGPAKTKTDWWGHAANMDLCGNLRGRWTVLKPDLEILEASDGPDHLWGDDGNNVIWGRGGGDHMYGLDGDDELLGADGNDVIDGGGGKNVIKYGKGG